ncbi:hypothetical protein S245_021915 [Arachis hypogaea]
MGTGQVTGGGGGGVCSNNGSSGGYWKMSYYSRIFSSGFIFFFGVLFFSDRLQFFKSGSLSHPLFMRVFPPWVVNRTKGWLRPATAEVTRPLCNDSKASLSAGVHASIIQRGLEQDHLIISRFIFLSASFATTASYYTSVFDHVLGRSPFLWNSLIGAHTKGSYFFDALSAFIRMKAHGSLLDRYTYSSVIKACSSMCRSCEEKLLHGSALRCGG